MKKAASVLDTSRDKKAVESKEELQNFKSCFDNLRHDYIIEQIKDLPEKADRMIVESRLCR